MLEWISNSEFKLGKTKFTIDLTHGKHRRPSEKNDFTIVKTKRFISHYLKLIQEYKNFENVLEIGLFQGGGLVFINELIQPKKLVGVELSPLPIEPLTDYILNDRNHIKIYYDTSQADKAKLKDILEKDFEGSLDLVVDDASHLYGYTKDSFEFLFPRLNPGGVYIIEDWAWSFRDPHQNPANNWYEKPALANLVIECFEEIATNTMIESIQVFEEMAIVRKSTAKNTNPLFSKKARRGRDINMF